MNYIKLLLVTFLSVLFTALASAYDFDWNGIYFNKTSSRTVAVSNKGISSGGYQDEYTGHVSIPLRVTYGGVTYDVTSIGENAFSNCTGLTSVTIPESVTSIGNSAFNGCTGLTSVTIPESVTSIGNSAFNGCTGLTSVTIPESVTSIGEYAFGGNVWEMKLTTIYYNAVDCTDFGANEWGSLVFSQSIKVVIFGDKVKTIPDYAFSNCYMLSIIKIPDSVISIGKYAFFECSNIKSVTIGSSVKSIGVMAFNECKKLSELVIKDSPETLVLESHGNYDADTREYSSMFYLCPLETIYMGRNISYTRIHSGINCTSFEGKTTLSTLTIGHNVTYISEGEFSGCTGLKSVYFPSSVTKVEDEAFYGCTGLTAVYMHNSSLESIGVRAFAKCSGVTSLKIPDTVKSIEGAAFGGCKGLTSLFLGESVTSLGGGCFSGCSGISDVKFPESLESIGAESFYGCVGLKAIVIPKNVKSIGVCAFAECTGLKEVEFNADNCELCGSGSKNEAFPQELSKVTFGENVTNIPDYAFYNCKGITEITIPKSINKIGKNAFYGTGLEKLYYNSLYCETLSSFPASLTSVIIGDAVRKLNGYIFSDCENLKAVYISDLESWCSNTELTVSKSNPLYYAHSLYYNGEKLEHLEIPSTISKIGQFQFVNCSDLKSIVIPESIEEIGYNAFDGCTGVRDFYLYHETPISIGYYDFASFRQYATVHVPKGALDNYKEDMYWSRFYDIVDDLEPAGIDENIKDENGKIEIYDMRGVKLYSGDKESCHKLPSGCYIMVKGTETSRIYIR